MQVVIVGNGGVGKSSMIQRYCKGIYTKDYKKTIGVDFLERQIEYVLISLMSYVDLSIPHLHFRFSIFRIDGEDIRIMLWDTAGTLMVFSSLCGSFTDAFTQVKRNSMRLPKRIIEEHKRVFWHLAQLIECHLKQSKIGK